MKKLAVVILNWNGRTLLEQFLPSLCRYTDYEGVDLIVADNGSTDDSIDYIKAHYPQVQVLAYPDNKGFAGGYNRALRDVKAEIYCLLNSDVEVTQGWIDAPLAFFATHPMVAAIQPKIKSYKQTQQFEYAGAAGGYIDRYGYPYCRGRLFDSVEVDSGQYEQPVSVGWATGAALFIRSKSFWAVGGFDEAFFAHMEEIDLALRIQRRGETLFCVPSSVVYHVGGATLESGDALKVKLNFRNNLLMLYKNLSRNRSREVLLVRSFLDVLSALMFYLKGEKRACKAVFEARSEYKKMRRIYQPPKDEMNPLIPGRGSVVMEYYLLRRRYFSSLSKKLQAAPLQKQQTN